LKKLKETDCLEYYKAKIFPIYYWKM